MAWNSAISITHSWVGLLGLEARVAVNAVTAVLVFCECRNARDRFYKLITPTVFIFPFRNFACILKKLQQRFRNKKIGKKLVPNLKKIQFFIKMYYIVITKKNNEMCAITFLKACTLSRISSARVTFYIQNCFYSELLEKKKCFPSAKLKKIISRNFQVSH